MIQVIGQGTPRSPSFGQRLSAGLGQALESGQKLYEKNQRDKAMQQAGFGDLIGLDPDLQKLAVADRLKGQRKQQEFRQQAKMFGLELPGEEEPQSFGNQINQQPQERPAPQEMAPPEEPEQPPQRKQDQSWYDNLSEKQRSAFALMNPQAANVLERARKFTEEKRKSEPGYKRDEALAAEQAKQDAKFYSDLNEKRSKQILKKESLGRLEGMTKRKVTGKLYETFLDKLGLTGKTSTGRREYAAEVKNQFTDFKQIAGSQISAQEFFTLANAYPNADFSPEANKAIIENLKTVHDTLDKEYEIAQRLKRENKGKPPEDIQTKVNEELQQYVSGKMAKMKENFTKIMNAQYGIQPGFTLMFDSEGEPLNVPDSDVVKLIEGGLADLP